MSLTISVISCAVIEPPPGGPQDKNAPDIKQSTPINGQLNYKGNTIELEFDEFIVQNNLNQELMVSPPLKHKPTIKVGSKWLKVTLKDTLLDNTTYTFSFGSGIKDFTEGNPLDSNVIVFSTGSFIDSGSVKGVLLNALTRSPEAKTLVMLYAQMGDSIPAKQRPIYYTKTNESGEFKIGYLKEGKYQVFCLDDKNNNYLYDLPNERIGFGSPIVIAGDSVPRIGLTLFGEAKRAQFYSGGKSEELGKIVLGFNKPVSNLKLKLIEPENTEWRYHIEYDENKDTVFVWTDLKVDKEIRIEITDGGEILDTASLKIKPFPTDSNELKKASPQIQTNIENGIAKYFEPLLVSLSRPIHSLEFKGYLVQNNDTVLLNPNSVVRKNDQIQINHTLKQESQYILTIYGNSFTDVLGFKNDTFKTSFKTQTDVEYANLSINLTNSFNSTCLVILMDQKGNVKEERVLKLNETSLNFNLLEPNKYQLKLIVDENSNGKWDPGSFTPRKQSERVIYFSGELDIKEGWDKKIEWIIPEE
jgi:uncharacterized protein (DUF2141 family)